MYKVGYIYAFSPDYERFPEFRNAVSISKLFPAVTSAGSRSELFSAGSKTIAQ